MQLFLWFRQRDSGRWLTAVISVSGKLVDRADTEYPCHSYANDSLQGYSASEKTSARRDAYALCFTDDAYMKIPCQMSWPVIMKSGKLGLKSPNVFQLKVLTKTMTCDSIRVIQQKACMHYVTSWNSWIIVCFIVCFTSSALRNKHTLKVVLQGLELVENDLPIQR